MPAKIIASVTHTALQMVASRYVTACALRFSTPRSSASISRMKTPNPAQAHIGKSMMR